MSVRTRTYAAVIATLILIGLVYYGAGVPFLFFKDSAGYLDQGSSLFSAEGYTRHAARTVGYPLVLRLVSLLPPTAISLCIVQALIVFGAYRLLYGHLVRASTVLGQATPLLRERCLLLLPVWLASTASYSGLHNFIVAMLPEVPFAALALLNVVLVVHFVRRPGTRAHLWGGAGVAALSCALPLYMKPHWMLAGPLLLCVVTVRLVVAVHAQPRAADASSRRWLALALAVLLPALVYAATMRPEQRLSETVNPEASLFGVRTLFCNRLHLINAALAKDPSIRLSADAAIDATLRQAMRDEVAKDRSPWPVQGYDGDICLYDGAFQALVHSRLPTVAAEREFLTHAITRSVLADPLPFLWLFVRQMLLGLDKTFSLFAVHQEYFPQAESLLQRNPHALDGIARVDVGPLNSRERTRSTLLGQAVNGTLAVSFWTLQIVYLGLVAATLLGPFWTWRRWESGRRLAFAAYLAVPLAAVLAHHALVALSHTFDIRRYAFNVFFVNLAFVAAAGVFWPEEYARARRRTAQPLAAPQPRPARAPG